VRERRDGRVEVGDGLIVATLLISYYSARDIEKRSMIAVGQVNVAVCSAAVVERNAAECVIDVPYSFPNPCAYDVNCLRALSGAYTLA
jgi:hypothetical protein